MLCLLSGSQATVWNEVRIDNKIQIRILSLKLFKILSTVLVRLLLKEAFAMKSTIKFSRLLGVLCGSNNLMADVPHVFDEGGFIRAEQMNENFSSINSQITTIKSDVEENSFNPSDLSEDYTYSVKDLTPGIDRLSVLGEVYDIIQLDTVSFNDHSLYTIKLPHILSRDAYNNPDYYPNRKALDVVQYVGGIRTTEVRNDLPNAGFSNTISGYPASISVLVANQHNLQTLFPGSMTREEFDAATYTTYQFSLDYNGDTAAYDIAKIRLFYIDANPSSITDPEEVNSYDCFADWSTLTEVNSFTWNVTTGTSSKEEITSIEDFNSILTACKTAQSAITAETQRVNKYSVATSIDLYVQINLDPNTRISMNYSFDEATYSEILGNNCSDYGLTNLQKQNCDVTVAPFDRNFSDDFNVQVKLPAKSTREGYVKNLFTLLDHIVISSSDNES